MKSQIITVMGQDWNVGVIGPEDADQTLLLCNGIGASIETVAPLTGHFKRTRLIAFDVPGVGRSPTPFSPYRLTNLTRMLDKILTELGVGQVNVFGVSWGGALAQQFAHDFQTRCRSLTLAATSAGMIMVPGKLKVLSKIATPKRYEDPNHMLDIGAEIYGGGVAFNKELLREHAMAMRAGDKRGYTYQLLAGIGWTSFFWLSRIKIPTFILMGENDPIIPVVNGQIMARRLPNATVETVPCGHMFVLTEAADVAERVEAFIHDWAAEPA
ncbi:MAG: poly(3-hydroxyalkanoate) depolymerase [Pseudomonadota bacterium]